MTFFDIIQSFIPLLVIIALLAGALYLVRRYSFAFKPKKSGLVKIEVLSNHVIMPKKYISVVRVQDKLMILGLSENGITLLKETEYEEVPGNELPATGFKQNFMEILKQNLGMK